MRGTQIFQIIRTMNITKAIAEQVATKIVKPIAECISNEHDMLNDIVKDIAVRGIPEQVYDTFTKYPRYFYQTRSVYIVNGSQVTRVEIKEWLPVSSGGGGLNVPCTAEESEKVSVLQERIEELRDEKSRTYNSIVNTLLSLRNSKKVKEAFPEAYEYIKGYEDKTTTEVALPVETIMKTINKYK